MKNVVCDGSDGMEGRNENKQGVHEREPKGVIFDNRFLVLVLKIGTKENLGAFE